MEAISVRPRELRWYHAAGLLFGDWGTSRLYVLGLAFVLTGYSSLWYVIAMCVLVTLVGISYTIVCKHFPDGGGVYSAAKMRSRNLAVVGALLLFADYIVTAALSAYEGFRYILPIGVDARWALYLAMLAMLAIGVVNFFGLRRPGMMAFLIAAGSAGLYLVLAAFCMGGGGHAEIIRPQGSLGSIWSNFANVILALSGVEAIANMTGVIAEPSYKNARRAILIVMTEVVVLNIVMAWGMNALSSIQLGAYSVDDQRDHMVKILALQYVGPWFAMVSSIVFGVLLLSASNTAVAGMVSIQYLMSRDKEMPTAFTRLNRFGMPWVSLAVATAVTILVLLIVGDHTELLASLYAIGVVGAIAINLLACGTNRLLVLNWWERLMLLAVGLLMAGLEFTVAWDKPKALLFACLVLGGGLIIRVGFKAYVRAKVVPVPEAVPEVAMEPAFVRTPWPAGAARVLVCTRGNPKLIRFAAAHAKAKNAVLFVLFVREVVLEFAERGGALATESMNLNRDKEARGFFNEAKKECDEEGVHMVPIYAVHNSPAELILDNAAMLGVEALIMGASRRGNLARMLRGDVLREVTEYLPERIPLIIYS